MRMDRPKRWRIIIRLRKNNKDRILFTKESDKSDPEMAWSTIFSDWLRRHRDLVIIGTTKNGLKIKDSSGISELFVDYKKVDSGS